MSGRLNGGKFTTLAAIQAHEKSADGRFARKISRRDLRFLSSFRTDSRLRLLTCSGIGIGTGLIELSL